MGFLGWTMLTSAVLLLMALASSFVRDLPISTSMVYLLIGIVLGPVGFDVVSLDVTEHAGIVERVAEAAVVIALFIGGLKLRLGWRDPAWRAAVMLAGPIMIVCIAALAVVAHVVLGLPPAAALLLAAILAPTDPVLASAVSVSDADDCDRMRCGLSGEAGLNDGTAFPFVVLALGLAAQGTGSWLVEWAALRVLWAIPAALLLGYALGKVVGRIAIALRTRQRDTTAPSDLLALALIGVAYVLADLIGAWGFLSVFAAGLGLRAAELHVVHESPHPDTVGPDAPEEHPPAEALVAARVQPEALEQPAVAAGVLVSETLSFGDTVDRLVEVGMIVAIGVALATHWDPRALVIAAALFLAIRPLATRLLLSMTKTTTTAQRWLIGWFGIRGIGSLYYLGYALTHGAPSEDVDAVVGITISVIALSILVHGISSTPLLRRYERSLA